MLVCVAFRQDIFEEDFGKFQNILCREASPEPRSGCRQCRLTSETGFRPRQKNAGKSWQDGGYVFSTMIGTPIEPRNMNRHFDRLCEKAGVRRIRFHDLRHSCASLLYSQGVPLEIIQDVLGHSSPTVTKVIYVDVAEDVTRDAVDKLDFLFGEQKEE